MRTFLISTMNLALNHVHTQHGYDGNVTFAVDHTFKVLQTAACTLPAKPSSHKASSYSTLCDGGLQQTPLSGTGPHTTMCCCGGLHHTTFQCAGPHTTMRCGGGLHHTTFQCAGPHTTSMLIRWPEALCVVVVDSTIQLFNVLDHTQHPCSYVSRQRYVLL